MAENIKFTIDGKECEGKPGQTIVEAANDNGVYIPVLCYFEGVKPTGSCRICTVKANGRFLAACTSMIAEGMEIENETPELKDKRKAVIEMLFVEGNHFCPSCEKSGNCDLQALAYKYEVMAPRFPYEFAQRELDATTPKLIIERNRCILCRRCVAGIRNSDGKGVFAFTHRGNKAVINIDHEIAATLTDEQAQKAMDLCPVGAIIKKEEGFKAPIGTRKYDKKPIGSND